MEQNSAPGRRGRCASKMPRLTKSRVLERQKSPKSALYGALVWDADVSVSLVCVKSVPLYGTSVICGHSAHIWDADVSEAYHWIEQHVPVTPSLMRNLRTFYAMGKYVDFFVFVFLLSCKICGRAMPWASRFFYSFFISFFGRSLRTFYVRGVCTLF